jgi:hypothetical protein
MQRITIRHRLQEGTVFARDALSTNVGGSIPFTVPGFAPVKATLVACEIETDGETALLTLDVPDPARTDRGDA